ncbi:hypothetical protein [Deinococcus ruber]|uniref:Lipoprotein n=1 Tax=Deinococcus ruber TaxID=1848197 RepID=A0A918FC70_9DEIO|nr:hypothetical protein [Deinococcus ruber]GGR29744.1 hypothetical protein GCM10008957_45880 [Deinococcus ruber]
MSRLLPIAAAAFLLAACAPTLQGAGGRIVNVKTGEEGTVAFIGTFQDRAMLPTDPDNVRLTIGERVFSGRYTVLGSGGANLGFTLGYGDPAFWPSGWQGGPYGSLSGQLPSAANITRPGNLIAKTAPAQGQAVQTLTCTFQIDDQRHGIGNCQDSGGDSYSLQF